MTFAEVCAGAGGMSRGLEAAGLECRWLCENDPAAAGVLAIHHPTVPIYADLTRFYPSPADRVDVLAGGTPCQDLSMAGARKGLAGERSGLFFQLVRLCRRLRPSFVLWENVGGALSSNGGRDFAAIIGAFTGCTPEVPPDGWGSLSAGFAPAVAQSRWNVAWRVLDTQFFGCPQRRERVFLVASLGAASCVEVLLEPTCLSGDFAQGREEGEGVAGTLANRAGGGGGIGTDFGLAGGLQVATGTLNSNGKAAGSATQQDAESGMLVAHSLRADCFDASEDRTGRGTPLVPVPIAFSCKDHGSDAGSVSPTLRGMGHAESHANAGGQVAVAFQESQSGVREYKDAGTLRSAGPGHDPVGTRLRTNHGPRRLTPTECERLQGWPDGATAQKAVLRLDGNLWARTGQTKPQADGPRYKQLGNGVSSPVAEWLGRRLVRFAATHAKGRG